MVNRKNFVRRLRIPCTRSSAPQNSGMEEPTKEDGHEPEGSLAKETNAADPGPSGKKSTATNKACLECKTEKSPYRCPACYFRYCSKECCHVHKSRCEAPSSSRALNEPHGEEAAQIRESKRKYEYAFPSEDTLSVGQLLDVKEDDRILEMLKSPNLRAWIERVDASSSPKRALKEAMEDPEFQAFSDRTLEIMGVKKDGPT